VNGHGGVITERVHFRNAPRGYLPGVRNRLRSLASDMARYITGVTLPVEGGYLAY